MRHASAAWVSLTPCMPLAGKKLIFVDPENVQNNVKVNDTMCVPHTRGRSISSVLTDGQKRSSFAEVPPLIPPLAQPSHSKG